MITLTTEQAKRIESIAFTQELRLQTALKKAEKALLDAGAYHAPDSVDPELWDRFDAINRKVEALATARRWLS